MYTKKYFEKFLLYGYDYPSKVDSCFSLKYTRSRTWATVKHVGQPSWNFSWRHLVLRLYSTFVRSWQYLSFHMAAFCFKPLVVSYWTIKFSTTIWFYLNKSTLANNISEMKWGSLQFVFSVAYQFKIKVPEKTDDWLKDNPDSTIGTRTRDSMTTLQLYTTPRRLQT